jgi:glycosyltransferase involved in cell wall biosynthesis/CDP-glycerol glycerophosphotransferase (TagB/SpsB family)
LIAAVYNVASYLPEFIRSIEVQTHPLSDVLVVLVDDGSTDASLELLRDWERQQPDLVQVVSQTNGGQAAARNAGLALVAECEWVSFPDPDDALDANYLSEVAAAIDAAPDLAMVATNRLVWREATGDISDQHPLRDFFARGNQIENLDDSPDLFHGAANAAFFRGSLIVSQRLRFDPRIRPNFEDGHFCQRYLLAARRPLVAFWASARYLYRRRADQSSTTQTSALRPSRFVEVPRHGYLELLREGAARRHTGPPVWLQNMVIYELTYYLKAEDSAWSGATACRGEVAEVFVDLLRQIRAELDPAVIEGFSRRLMRAHWRQILLHGLGEERWHTPYVVRQSEDIRHGQVLVAYRFTGPDPGLAASADGHRVTPVASKIRTYHFWEHEVLQERRAWLPAAAAVEVALAGEPVEIGDKWLDYVRPSLGPAEVRLTGPAREPSTGKRELAAGPPGLRRPINFARRMRSDLSRRQLRLRATRRAAELPPIRRRFADAWVLMDRVSDAADNGERLFEYLRAHRPDINAWFVIDRGSRDFARLRKESNRIIAYGSWPWKLLMLNASHLISSHIGAAVHRPEVAIQLRRGLPPWRFTFLQHGVIRDDISGWLNRKELDLFVTSSPAEHESIVGDGTNYVFTDKEVKRTGLARFDRLARIADTVSDAEQDLILVVPTWRSWLSPEIEPGEQRRVVSDFESSQYAHNWFGLLRSPALRDLCAAEGLRIGFLPHPLIQTAMADIHLPDHVLPLRYEDTDVQRLFARAAVMVTDYSSTVFNAAYIDRPVSYFQFDRELVEAGGHVGKKGYFDWERDGFGPVSSTVEDAVSDIVATVTAGRRLREPYAARAARTFPERDGRCCERIVAAIEAL